MLSVVVYLNKHWVDNDGGELVIYDKSMPTASDPELHKIKVCPNLGTIAVFLSEEFPHELLATKCDRYSIAGWFRLNSFSSD